MIIRYKKKRNISHRLSLNVVTVFENCIHINEKKDRPVLF